MQNKQNVDWVIFSLSAVLLFSVSIPLMVWPEAGGKAVAAAFDLITGTFGNLYVVTSWLVLGFLGWVALSRHGKVRLGDGVEFSTFSWASMLFAAGIGTSVVYWGTIEWVYYYRSPPMGAAPYSDAALDWAVSYGPFHWGISGWAFYCVPAVCIAYAHYVRKWPYLRLSAACEPLLGRHVNGWAGRIVDLLFMVGLIGSASTGIGFGTPLISEALSALTGRPDSLTQQVFVLIGVTCLFALSVYLGVEKGIRRLSTINVVLMLVFLLVVLLIGPTMYLLGLAADSLGFLATNFLRMATNMDAEGSRFVRDWTVFYWAWWLALGPFVGMFITRISKGRSLRQLVFGVLGFGALGCALVFYVLGGYAVYLEREQIVPVVQIVTDSGNAAGVIAVIGTLPASTALFLLFALICIVFMATTYDSASYTLAASASRELKSTQDPAPWHRAFWAISLGLLPISLLFLGGMQALQTASVVVSLPLIVVFLMMGVSLVLALRSADAGLAPKGTSPQPSDP